MKRNILFFFPDQWHVDWLGCRQGGSTQTEDAVPGGPLPLKTPNLDRLAAGGTLFTRAFTPSPLCAPARACLASGKTYEECGVANNNADYPLNQPTFYQRLRDRDYRVASVGKLDLHKNLSKPLDWGLDGSRLMNEWGFTEGVDNEGKMDGKNSFLESMKPKGPYLNYLYQRNQALAEAYAREPQAEGVTGQNPYVSVVDEEAYCDNWLAGKGMEYLKEFPADKPWFLQVNFTGPHGPFDVTKNMSEAWKGVDFPAPHDSRESCDSSNPKRQHYAAMIENIDRLVGEFLEIVKDRGEEEETLLVFAADHGDMMGEHGHYGKCTWHRGSASIPLIISGPGVEVGRKSDALVMLQDLTATFMDLSRAEPLEDQAGSSLLPLLAGKTDKHRDSIESELTTPDGIDWHMICDGREKLVTDRAKGVKLRYDLTIDPLEINPQSQEY